MRVIEKKMLQALAQGKTWQLNNTYVCGNSISLSGHHIADMVNGECVVNRETLRRWPSVTTKSRLRALGANVYTKDYCIYLDGVKL